MGLVAASTSRGLDIGPREDDQRTDERQMMTKTDQRDRQSRIAALWQTRPDSDYETVAAEADAQLAAEAAEQAKAEATARELSASLEAMALTCPACGTSKTASAELCPACGRVVGLVRAQRAGAEPVGDSTRAELVSAYIDARG